MAHAGSCYERKRRQNIHQVFLRVKYCFNHREERSQIFICRILMMSHVTQRLTLKYLGAVAMLFFRYLQSNTEYHERNSLPAKKDPIKPKDLFCVVAFLKL